MTVVYILIALLIVLLLAMLSMYNSLVAKRNQVSNIFGTLDAMLKKRWDLVPNLTAAVKGYMQHERQVLERIAEVRSQTRPETRGMDEKVAFDNEVSKAIGQVFLAVEAYPQLKASDNFLHLQRTLVELEEQISAARRAFNASVTDYNNAVDMFPSNIAASLFGFPRKAVFEVPDLQRQAPSVAGELRQ
jgi:LemA protein